jgi:hypothetical protein
MTPFAGMARWLVEVRGGSLYTDLLLNFYSSKADAKALRAETSRRAAIAFTDLLCGRAFYSVY